MGREGRGGGEGGCGEGGPGGGRGSPGWRCPAPCLPQALPEEPDASGLRSAWWLGRPLVSRSLGSGRHILCQHRDGVVLCWPPCRHRRVCGHGRLRGGTLPEPARLLLLPLRRGLRLQSPGEGLPRYLPALQSHMLGPCTTHMGTCAQACARTHTHMPPHMCTHVALGAGPLLQTATGGGERVTGDAPRSWAGRLLSDPWFGPLCRDMPATARRPTPAVSWGHREMHSTSLPLVTPPEQDRVVPAPAPCWSALQGHPRAPQAAAGTPTGGPAWAPSHCWLTWPHAGPHFSAPWALLLTPPLEQQRRPGLWSRAGVGVPPESHTRGLCPQPTPRTCDQREGVVAE